MNRADSRYKYGWELLYSLPGPVEASYKLTSCCSQNGANGFKLRLAPARSDCFSMNESFKLSY